MATRTQIREQYLADIITAAVEGGTNYWASCLRYKWVDLPPAEVHAVLMDIDAAEARDEDKIHVNVDSIAKGIGLILKPEFSVRADVKQTLAEANRENDASDIDAEIADIIVQAAAFGRIVYG